MKIYNPFEIVLDSYSEECKNLYAVVQSICDFPKMQFNEDDYAYDLGIENKLYSTAFAYICHDYLLKLRVMDAHEDFETVCDGMNFEENEEFIFEIAKAFNIDFDENLIQQQKQSDAEYDEYREYDELVFNIIKKYREKIAAKIKTVLTTDELQLTFFGSIFFMDETSEFEPSLSLDTYFYPALFLY